MARDDMKFKIVKTDPIKNTVVLRPTIGTLLKFNIVFVGALYVGKMMLDYALDELRDEIAEPEPDPEDTTPED